MNDYDNNRVVDETSPMHGLCFYEFDHLDEQVKDKIRGIMARLCEQSFRRGFQQGWDSHSRGDKVCDLHRWRFCTTLSIAVSPQGGYMTTSEKRLEIENWIASVGLGTTPDMAISAAEITRWIAPLFPSAFRRSGISKSVRFRVLHRDGFRCRYCGALGSETKLHVDHVMPRSKGGSDDPENLVTACEACNLGKGTTVVITEATDGPHP